MVRLTPWQHVWRNARPARAGRSHKINQGKHDGSSIAGGGARAREGGRGGGGRGGMAEAGIGAAIVRALAAAGARVCVTDLNAEAAAELAAALGGESPGTHPAMRLDVTNAAETDRVFDAAIAALGGLDIVCANAGISTMNRVADLTEAEWDANMAGNAKGIFLSNRPAARRWPQAKG